MNKMKFLSVNLIFLPFISSVYANNMSVQCSQNETGERLERNGYTYLVVNNESIREEELLTELEQGRLSFCTSHVTDMSYLFRNRTQFNRDISDWDTSNVKNMQGMFYNARVFNHDIGCVLVGLF